MTQEPSEELEQTFAQHVRAFRDSLPPEEQLLLSQVFRYAHAGLTAGDEVSGYIIAVLGASFPSLLGEIGFPALDASSKDAAKMTMKFSPETSRLGGIPPLH
ncbi:MAG: hypothetical protein ACYDCQ_14170 [Dehalococcoidia bacterium]